MNFEESLSKFEFFCDEFHSLRELNYTESDTRSKIIDKIFIDVLGWEELNIEREGHTSAGYFDYIIKLLGRQFMFVVEAKKISVNFQLPINSKQTTINALMKSPQNEEVVTQIRGYIKEKELEYGVITNGHQFIIGRFYGANFRTNKCLIFNGLNDIKIRFVEFYNALSRNAVMSYNGFLIREEKEEPKTIFSTLTDKHYEVIIRNTLRPELQRIVDYVFDEIHKYEELKDKDIINECFVKNAETKANQDAIERLFADHTPQLNEVFSPKTDSTFSQLKDSLINNHVSINVAPPKPIILIGTRGAGKTTFINYFFKVYMNNVLQNKNPYIYLDFKKYLNIDFKDSISRIYEDILDELQERFEFLTEPKILERVYLKEIKIKKKLWDLNPDNYNIELQKFLSERYSNIDNHFINLSEYLIKDRQIRICIIIDNADQLDEEYQKSAYMLAQNLFIKAKCATIISLREGYYYKYRDELPFNAFGADKVFHITAPPYREVLQKRIDYTITRIDNFEGTHGNVDEKKIIFSPENLKNFFNNINKTLFGVKNSEMLRYLEQNSQNNIREGLKSFRYFLESGHTKLEDYFLRQAISTDEYSPIPIWEFIKSLGLDNKLYYNHEISRIKNLFYPEEGSTSHFTKIKILKYLFEKTKKGGYNEKFVSYSELLDFFKKFSYDEVSIFKNVQRLLKFRFIETQTAISDIEIDNINITLDTSICISFSGYYYLDELICRFHYIDLVLQDTPIFSQLDFEKIKMNFPYTTEKGKRDLYKRKQVVEYFISYLSSQEILELSNSEGLSELERKVMSESIVQYIMDKKLQKDLSRLLG